MVSTDYGGPTHDDLDDVLDRYDPDEIRIMLSHDGFSIFASPSGGDSTDSQSSSDYKDEGESNIGDELLWKWDPAHDREPFGAMETLFNRLGFEIENM